MTKMQETEVKKGDKVWKKERWLVVQEKEYQEFRKRSEQNLIRSVQILCLLSLAKMLDDDIFAELIDSIEFLIHVEDFVSPSESSRCPQGIRSVDDLKLLFDEKVIIGVVEEEVLREYFGRWKKKEEADTKVDSL